MEERVYTIAEIKQMCLMSYMRGMSIQYDADKKRKRIPKVFSEWVDELIENCPKNKFV